MHEIPLRWMSPALPDYKVTLVGSGYGFGPPGNKPQPKWMLTQIYVTIWFPGMASLGRHDLTHWGRAMHICVSKLTIIGSDNGLLPGRRQAIIRTSAGILLIGPLGTDFSEIINQNSNIFTQENAFENVVWKMAAILSRPQCVNSLRNF